MLIATAFFSPAAYDDVIGRVRAPDPGARKSGHSKPICRLDAVYYGDDSGEAFLRRPWHDLYDDQPGARADPHRALDTAYYEDLAGRL